MNRFRRLLPCLILPALLMMAAAIAQQVTPYRTNIVPTRGSKFVVIAPDGKTEVSSHQTQHAAEMAAISESLNNGGATYFVRQCLELRVNATALIPPKPPVNRPTHPITPRNPPTEPKSNGPDASLPFVGSRSHAHFEALRNHPQALKSWSLREQSHYANRRGGRFPNGVNPFAKYDPAIDAAKVSLPPRSNKLMGRGGFELEWGTSYPWEFGDKLVVQHDFLMSKVYRDHVQKPGTNGRFVNHHKFTNLLRGSEITYELRLHFGNKQDFSLVDLRVYPAKGEGRTERDELASDVADPATTQRGSGGGYDRHPGPDSSWEYGQADVTHPSTFVIMPDRWVRVTYELTRVEEGTRVKVWLADEQTTPRLIIASPSDPTNGFLVLDHTPVNALYIELDTSQGTSYAEDQPDRWIGFRNLAVLAGVDGESVLGGKPVK